MATSIYIVAAHQVRRRYAIDIQFLYFYVIFIHSSPVGSAIATPMHFSGHRNFDDGVVIVMPKQICQKHKIIFSSIRALVMQMSVCLSVGLSVGRSVSVYFFLP